MPDRLPRRSDRGETLVELLMTVVILGTAVVAVIGALAVAIRVSDQHRKQATAGAAVRAFAEVLEGEVAKVPTGYEPCASPSHYLSMYTAVPAGYQPFVDEVKIWDGTGWVAATPAACNDTGIQLVSLRVASADGRVTESLAVVLRRPCRPEVDGCDP